MPRNSHSTHPPLKAKRRLTAPVRNFAILIVDDDEDFLEAVQMQVSRIAGANVSVARNCDEAVAHLAVFPYDLVICDWALASRTGPEVFHLADPLMVNLAHQNRRRIPVMFMSGSEKVASTQGLRSFKYFEPVTFILKTLGPAMIRIMAENILRRFKPYPCEEPPCVYIS